jgi:transcription elongation factor Elf1
MAKSHRGKGIRSKPKSGRGTCPLCKRTGVKLVYEREVNKVKLTICKICNASQTRQAKAVEEKAQPQPETT